jgi:hypothetical protein
MPNNFYSFPFFIKAIPSCQYKISSNEIFFIELFSPLARFVLKLNKDLY